MMQAFDPVCFDAFAQLLAQPDPADLPRRAHVLVCEGDPNRRETRLPGILMGWLQRRHMDVDVEEPLEAAKRTAAQRRGRLINPGLRLLPRTGTDD
jgi:hypothetical protein